MRYRWIGAIAGLVAVAVLATPAGGHVGGTVSHLWNTHIKPRTDARYYTKTAANARYVNENELLWAVVNADVTIARSHGAVSVAGAGVGNYIVRFNRDVRGCNYTGTIGLSGAAGVSAPGFITVVGAAVDVRGVFVTTDDVAGASAARGFHLIADCASQMSPALTGGVRVGGGGVNTAG
jgi:hypothetical protein